MRAGELLSELNRGKNQYDQGSAADSVSGASEYRCAIEEADVPERTAQRWQKVAEVPEPVFEEYISETKGAQAELSTSGVLRASSLTFLITLVTMSGISQLGVSEIHCHHVMGMIPNNGNHVHLFFPKTSSFAIMYLRNK